MSKFFLIILLTSISYKFVNAQIIIDNKWDHSFIENQCEILKMKSEDEIPNEEIFSRKSDHLFVKFSSDLIIGKETFNWIKFNVNNTSGDDLNVYLGTSRFEKMYLYIKKDSIFKLIGVTGTKIPEADKLVRIEGLGFFNLNLGKGRTDFVIKGVNKQAPITPQLVVPLVISNKEFYKSNYENNSFYTLLFLGAICIMLLYNFLLLLATKQRAFLYYTSYVFFVSIFALGIIPQFALRLYGHMDINQFPISTAGTLSTIFYILFAAEIMETKRYYPKGYKFLLVLLLMLSIGLLGFIKPLMVISSTMNFLAAFLMSPTLLVLGFLMVRKKHLPGTYFFLGNVIFIISQLTLLLTLTNIIPPIILGFSGISIYQFGILIQLTLFSLGVASRINEIKELSHLKELESIRAQQLTIENKEISKEKKKAEQALSDLKATQALLIQNEKMASFGELTTGIAHEIQNPLNFVINFSELSVDLSKELKEEINKLNLDKQEKDNVSEIVDLLSSNQEKINHHGKRAADIVKGMLHHSRSSSGKKELININNLVEEYLKLAYHGLRVKPTKFTFAIQTDLDPSNPMIEVVSQDIGRVILNLVTNAFHAVAEKANNEIEVYKPSVSVVTKVIDAKWVEITVKDNGGGIPDDIKDKIFQPFFTTKPPGEGTGLGLSLAYDIVKAHGGEIRVVSDRDDGTSFFILLPITS